MPHYVVLHHHVPRDRQTHDEGVDCVGTANDVFKVVAPLAGSSLRFATCVGLPTVPAAQVRCRNS